MLVNPHTWRSPGPVLKGKGHIRGGELVEAPKDFAGSSYMSVEVLQDLLVAALFPETLPAHRRFDLRADDYAFLHRCMSMLPRECPHPRYDPETWYDSYVVLTAVLLVNANGIFNDGEYEYDEVGFPFLAEVGRERARRPDLGKWRLD